MLCALVNCATPFNYHLKSKVSIALHCQLGSTYYTVIKIKNFSKNTSVIKIATMKITDNFSYTKALMCITKSTPFAVSKDKWNTKEDAGKSMKNELYVLRYAKRLLLG